MALPILFRRAFVAASILALLAVAIAGSALAQDSRQDDGFVTIGTGGLTGVYYPAGGAIQRLVNRGTEQHGVRVTVESTGGSVYNLNAMAAGELDVGVAQSDWQAHAYNGGHPTFPEGNQKLRSLFSLHAEPFTIVARADAGIAMLDNLKGKRINIGNPGSGQRATMEEVMRAQGWTLDDFSAVSELSSAEQSQALCDNSFDAMVFSVGHPSGSIQEAAATCDIVLVPVTGEAIDRLVAANPWYAPAEIPGGLYPGAPEPTPTFGVRATLVTTSDLPEQEAYIIVKTVFEQLDTFRRLHPAFATLTADEMHRDALVAPLHDGAKRYYDEAGM